MKLSLSTLPFACLLASVTLVAAEKGDVTSLQIGQSNINGSILQGF